MAGIKIRSGSRTDCLSASIMSLPNRFAVDRDSRRDDRGNDFLVRFAVPSAILD